MPEGHQGFHVGSLEGLQGPREELEGWLSEGPDPRSHPGVAPPLTASPQILRHHQISHGQVIQPQKWNILACSSVEEVSLYLQYVPKELLCALLFCWEWERECDDDSLPLELFAAWFACLCGCWELAKLSNNLLAIASTIFGRYLGVYFIHWAYLCVFLRLHPPILKPNFDLTLR